MPQFNCEFNSPSTWENIPPNKIADIWNYSQMICNYPETSTIELISNATTGAEFYLRKEINYGDILIISFLMIFLIYGILKFLTDFIIPKFIRFKKII